MPSISTKSRSAPAGATGYKKPAPTKAAKAKAGASQKSDNRLPPAEQLASLEKGIAGICGVSRIAEALDALRSVVHHPDAVFTAADMARANGMEVHLLRRMASTKACCSADVATKMRVFRDGLDPLVGDELEARDSLFQSALADVEGRTGGDDTALLAVCAAYHAAEAAIETHEEINEKGFTKQQQENAWTFLDRLCNNRDEVMERLVQIAPTTVQGLREKVRCVSAFEQSVGAVDVCTTLDRALRSIWHDILGGDVAPAPPAIKALSVPGLPLVRLADDFDVIKLADRVMELHFESVDLPDDHPDVPRLTAEYIEGRNKLSTMRASTIAGLVAKAKVAVMTIYNPGGVEGYRPAPGSDEAFPFSIADDLLHHAQFEPHAPCPAMGQLDLMVQTVERYFALNALPGGGDHPTVKPKTPKSLAEEGEVSGALSLIFNRIDGMSDLLKTVAATSVSGAVLQLFAAQQIIDEHETFEGRKAEEAWKELSRILFSTTAVLRDLPENKVPGIAFDYFMGHYRDPFTREMSLLIKAKHQTDSAKMLEASK